MSHKRDKQHTRKGIKMNNGDWLIRAFANDQIPKKVKEMWGPITWGAVNVDMIPKIMGLVQCTESERQEIKKFLYDEHMYELLVAMTYAENYGKIKESDEARKSVEDFKAKCADNKVFVNLAQCQLLSFLKWCDKKDYENIFEGQSPLDIYRLCYIALTIGYNKLALLLIGMIGEQVIAEGAAAMDRYGNKRKLLLKKWVYDFYRKQPKGKNRNKLAKRIIRYGTLMLSSPLEENM